MKRNALSLVVLFVVAACQSDRIVSPPNSNAGMAPVFAISDAGHGGNPNFVFLPPIANSHESGKFNPNLSPTVVICELQSGACKAGGYYEEFPNVGVTGKQYHLNWKSPKKVTTQYRISVEVLGVVLGFADVNTSKTSMPGFVGLNDGATLPIKFSITTDCPSGASCVDPNTGGTVVTSTPGGGIAGVTIPPQPGGGPPITITFGACDPDLGANGLIVFGSCIHVDSDLEGNLTNEAIVFICDVLTDPALPSGEDHDHVHLHRRHEGNINVLPNAASPLCPSVGGNASIGSVIRALAHREWKKAGGEFLGMIGPKPLYATVLHLGAGGSTGAFSDFQFALEQTLPIDWESAGWSYQVNGSVPEGWQTGALLGLTGQAGFGVDQNNCSLIQSATHTGWAPGASAESPSYLYLRRDVEVGASGFLQISIAIDNDFRLWVDGNEWTEGFLPHDGCPERGSSTASISVGPGVHKIAIQAKDRGGSSYFDASITFGLGEGG